MVIPNFFITFARHSFHTSHPLHIPSRERRHRPAPPCHQAPHSPHGTRAASRIKRTRLPHALHLARAMPHTPSALPPLAKSYAHAPHTRYASSPSALPPLAKSYAHTLRTHALTAHTPSVLPPPRKGYATHTPHAQNAAMLSLAAPPFCEESASLHNQNITYYNITCNVYPNRSKDYTKKARQSFPL